MKRDTLSLVSFICYAIVAGWTGLWLFLTLLILVTALLVKNTHQNLSLEGVQNLGGFILGLAVAWFWVMLFELILLPLCWSVTHALKALSSASTPAPPLKS